MPITYVEEGKTVQIQKITGKDKLRSHLANMGFVQKWNITVIQRVAGNMILEVKGTRVAIDEALANRIMV